jgi:hypothetical protein
MSERYVIGWKSKVNGRAGRGTKEFSPGEGQRLVEELNAEYPYIEHELMTAPAPRREAEKEAEAQEEPDESPSSTSCERAVSHR